MQITTTIEQELNQNVRVTHVIEIDGMRHTRESVVGKSFLDSSFDLVMGQHVAQLKRQLQEAHS